MSDVMTKDVSGRQMKPELTEEERDDLLSADANMIGLMLAGRYRDERINGATGLCLARDIQAVVLALRSNLKEQPEFAERLAAFDDTSPNEEIGGLVGDGSWRSLGTVGELRSLAANLKEQEPVAWRWRVQPDGSWLYTAAKPPKISDLQPLYASPTSPKARAITEVEVKALEWSLYTQGGRYAPTALGLNYEIAGTVIGRFRLSLGNMTVGTFDAIEAAKAAAQLDYATRIRSALVGGE